MPERMLKLLANRGWTRPRALQSALDISQPTFSRLVRRAGQRLVRGGRGPHTQYAVRREAFGAGGEIPLFAVRDDGYIEQLAVLHPVEPQGFYVETALDEQWIQGHSGAGRYDDLPYFLSDMRPQGFLGRQVAHRLEREANFPGNPDRWIQEQIGRYLIEYGIDLPGNLILGQAAAEGFELKIARPVTNREASYPKLTEEVMRDGDGGSSAGGEHPKFTAFTEDAGHVIVKFSPAGDSQEAVRWRDLLIGEWIALELLREHRVPAARAHLYIFDGRVFLEMERFDRRGERGRLPSISMAAVDAEFAGSMENWTKTGERLLHHRLLSSEDSEHLAWLDLFGEWIANNDRHLGNISLSPYHKGFQVLPVYDMLPMRYAPARGEVIRVEYRPPLRSLTRPGAAEMWMRTGVLALEYWKRLTTDERISEGFRAIAQGVRESVDRALSS